MDISNNYVNLPDEEILKLSLEEPEAFEIIVDRYKDRFHRSAKRIIGIYDADDAVQEAFVRMYIHAPKYVKKGDIKFSSWAYSILIRVCYTLYKKNKRRATFNLDPEITSQIEDFSENDLKEYRFDRDYLLSLISKLPSLLKRTLELYIFDQKTEKEIAEIEGVSYQVVRVRIHRAKSKLKEISLHHSGYRYES